MSQEENVWSGTPSQVVNFGAFIIWGVIVFLGISVVYYIMEMAGR